jgi:hypothetical protein
MKYQSPDGSIFEFSKLFFNTDFEEILSGIIACYHSIIVTNIKIPANDENAIRDIFLSKKHYLKNMDFKTAHYPLANYQFDKETFENKGRADIRIFHVNPYKNDEAYYIIECKRLNNKNTNGTTGLNGKYISNGIARFVSGRHHHQGRENQSCLEQRCKHRRILCGRIRNGNSSGLPVYGTVGS